MVLAPITLWLVWVTSRNFFTRRAARHGCSIAHYFWVRPAPLKFGRAKFGAISDNFRIWSRISPERIDLSKIGKVVDRLQPSHVGRKKMVNFGPQTKKLDTNYPPKLHFSGDYISALRACWPLKFLHVLEIAQGLLAHTPSGNGGPPKKFKGERVNWA